MTKEDAYLFVNVVDILIRTSYIQKHPQSAIGFEIPENVELKSSRFDRGGDLDGIQQLYREEILCEKRIIEEVINDHT